MPSALRSCKGSVEEAAKKPMVTREKSHKLLRVLSWVFSDDDDDDDDEDDGGEDDDFSKISTNRANVLSIGSLKVKG